MDSTMDEVLAQLREQQATIERLEARLASVERGTGAATPAPIHAVPPADVAVVDVEAAEGAAAEDGAPDGTLTTDRRRLLTRAATLTAGAVVGGAVAAVGQASPAAAASGTFDGNPAVTANANIGGIGVLATTTTAYAVRGIASGIGSGIGVSGQGNIGTRGDGAEFGVYATASEAGGIGVSGLAHLGVGVRGQSDRVAVEPNATAGTAAHIRFTRSASVPAPPTNSTARLAGDVVFDDNRDLWMCTNSGTPGTWRRISGPSAAGAFSALTAPVRVYDSRPGFAPAVGTKTPLAPNTARACDLKANGSGVPVGATAVLVSVVATNTTGGAGGFLSLYRNGIAWPGTSNLNWSGPNENVAVTTLTAVDGSAVCALYASQATNVVVDVLGYYR